MENRRRAPLISVLIILLCLSVCIGATYAYFTDRVTSNSNIIKMGKLDVTMEYANGTTDPANTTWTDASTGAIFNYEKWEPGYTEVYHIKISNVGTLALKYNLVIVANGTVSELADVIDVYYFDPAEQIDERADLVDTKKLGNLTTTLAGMKDTATGNLLAGETLTITIALKMQESAGNRYQGLSIGTDFSIQLHATQLDSETDNFGPDYDEDAVIPCPHIPDTWVVDVEPTVDTKGSKHATCTLCGRPFSEPIPFSESIVRFTLSNDGTYYIASGLNDTSVKDVVIPESYNGIPVKAVGENAFAGYYEITSVTIPYGVTDIGDRAFYSCSNLETVTIPYSVATMGEDVFLNDNNLTIYCRDEAVPTDWDSNWNLVGSYYDDELGEDVVVLAPVVFSWSYGEEYTYTFVTNSEECEIDSITSAAIITLPTPYNEDLIFGGWYTDEALNKKVTSSTYHSTTEHTLYAKWMTLEECFENATELTLDKQERVDITEEGQQAYFTFTPETTGTYAFYTSCVGGNSYVNTRGTLYDASFGDSIAQNDDGTAGDGNFVIVCELSAGQTYYLMVESFYSNTDTFNVAVVNNPTIYTLQAGDGAYIIEDYEAVDPPSSIVSPTAITLPVLYRDGYVFCGWYDNEACTGEMLPYPYYNEDNCTVYAKWMTLTDCFKAVNNDNVIELNETKYVDIVFAGQSVFYKFVPTADGTYSFSVKSVNGYSYYGAEGALYYEYGARVSNNWDDFGVSLELKGGQPYYFKVNMDSDYSTGSFDITVERKYTYTLVTSSDWNITRESNTGIYLPDSSASQGIFYGWYETDDFSGEVHAAGEYYFTGNDCTLYARYLTIDELLTKGTQIESINLEESGKPHTINITTGGQKVYFSFKVPDNALTAYTFLTSGNLGSNWDIYDSTADWITSFYGEGPDEVCDLQVGETYYLVAGFSSVETTGSYTITVSGPTTYTFDTNGADEIESITSGDEIYLPEIEKQGAIFLGWYDNAEFNGEALYPNDRYYSNTDCTLYAKWLTKDNILEQTTVTLEERRYSFADITYGGQLAYFTFTPKFSGTYHFLVENGDAGDIYDSNLNLIAEGVVHDGGARYAGRLSGIHCFLEAGKTYYLITEFYNNTLTGEIRVKTFAPIATYTFDTNGGDPIGNYVVTSIGTPLPTPVREDAIFFGWYDNATFDGEALNSNKYFCTTNCKLYAKWMTLEEMQDPQYVISFGETYDVNVGYAGPKAFFAFKTTKAGNYIIQAAHWLTCGIYDSALNQITCEPYWEDSFECELEAGQTYYLILECNSEYEHGPSTVTVLPTIKYTFDANGGIIFDEQYGIQIDSKTSATGISLPAPTKEGAIFLGWCEDPELTKVPMAAYNWYTSETDCTLYAKWIDLDGVKGCAIPMTLGSASPAEITTAGQTVFYSFTPSANGKYGFYTSSSCDVSVCLYDSNLEKMYDVDYNSSFPVAYNELKAGTPYYLVVKANCVEESYSLNVTVDVAYTYKIVTNSDYEEDYTITSATAITLWTPYNEGYIFDGWYEDESCTIKAVVDENGKYSSDSDCKLYARWIEEASE